ncbi:hypothetical protein EGW08_014290 [Elysia chlorotica]|uniref:Uncharacterized protein n=1 Tax=Elysia chlorotica TaxID=188477 RepID=A0A433T918_ELYCH|nr:hypothetical protein EGW08_014290 [Elysia chlorotica]
MIQNGSEERSENMDICENNLPCTDLDIVSPDNNNEKENTQNSNVPVTLEQDVAEKEGNSNPAKEKDIDMLSTDSDDEIAGEKNSGVMEKSTDRKSLLYDWSPSKSPSFSILKKSKGQTPSPGRNRVSFAEPVVNGESPIREKYHLESVLTPPITSKSTSQRRGTPFSRSLGKVSGYKRRLSQNARQVRLLQGPDSLPGSPTKSQSQTQYKATQESQLDSKNPIFPDLIDCSKPVDDILPQLTSSLWYRGLHHMMKGRSLNTIGDLAALTEVQINQLPIRHPKIDTVRITLKNYMAQHGLFKPLIKLSTLDASSSPNSKGATMEQAVTPSSIADEGIEIRRHDDDLDRLSPIEGVGPELCSTAAPSSSNNSKGESTVSSEVHQQWESSITSTLTKLVEDTNNDDNILKSLKTVELFEVHEKLNHLFSAVVGEMKSRRFCSF